MGEAGALEGVRRLGTGSGGISSLHITPALSPELLILAIGLATAVGAFAGLIPAWRASRLLPVEDSYST